MSSTFFKRYALRNATMNLTLFGICCVAGLFYLNMRNNLKIVGISFIIRIMPVKDIAIIPNAIIVAPIIVHKHTFEVNSSGSPFSP